MSIAVTESIAQTRAHLNSIRDRHPVGFVPTMGALHAGHRRLIETARRESGFVAVSIFVNPIQFDVREDYERYQRSLPADLELCEQAGADLVFAPAVEEMYPPGAATFVDATGLTDHFCGSSRPGHFRGVCTVVAKLFQIVAPQLAYFGEKDAQQLAVVRRMAEDLNFPIEIVGVPTVREPDGLALSSRNVRLTPGERAIAPCLYRALTRACESIRHGARDAAEVLTEARSLLDVPGVRVDYFDLADPAAMTPVRVIHGPVRAMGAVWIANTRLIDNVLCIP